MLCRGIPIRRLINAVSGLIEMSSFLFPSPDFCPPELFMNLATRSVSRFGDTKNATGGKKDRSVISRSTSKSQRYSY